MHGNGRHSAAQPIDVGAQLYKRARR